MGDFSARLWVEAGEYVAGTGDSTAGVGTRFQYRFTKAFRAWLTLAGQRDVDSGGHVTRSGSIAAGARPRWETPYLPGGRVGALISGLRRPHHKGGGAG